MVIFSEEVWKQLQELPGVTPDKARLLLDPADKQNVPKAVHLLQSLSKLATLDPPVTPADIQRRDRLSFLADTFGFFTTPFIDVTLDLSEQIRRLSAYGHIIAAMFIQHGTAFMTGALYADSQAIVKNIAFVTARLQDVDPDLPFYIILDGTDGLEKLFCDLRSLDHARNVDILECARKLSTGAVVSSLMEKYPDLDRGHRRLNLVDAEGVDRVNPHSWKGDVIGGHVNVMAEWLRGRDLANRVLRKYFGDAGVIDFPEIFSKADHDLLRPQGQYVGVRYEHDDDRTEPPEVLPEDATLSASPNPQSPPDTPLQPASDAPPLESTSADSTLSQTPDDCDEDFDDLAEGMDVEDFLASADEVSRPHSTSDVSDRTSHVLLYDDKKYLKSSLVTWFLTSKRSRKSVLCGRVASLSRISAAPTTSTP